MPLAHRHVDAMTLLSVSSPPEQLGLDDDGRGGAEKIEVRVQATAHLDERHSYDSVSREGCTPSDLVLHT
jgi:hypothetical protein